MEYYQMTINDWLDIKRKLQAEMLGVKRSFVRIGYMLRKIDEAKLYENDGYKNLSEWAKGEYGMEGSTVSRFMSINKAYSVGGFSEELLPEYEDFKRSQLEEMLKLPSADREMIRPETARQDIRELKQFNRAEPAAGVADDIHQLIRKFFEDNPDTLKEVYACDGKLDAMKEAVNPSGNRSYRKGTFFLMMYEDEIKLKKFGGNPESYSWERFFEIVHEIYGETMQERIAPAQIEEPEKIEKQEILDEAEDSDDVITVSELPEPEEVEEESAPDIEKITVEEEDILPPQVKMQEKKEPAQKAEQKKEIGISRYEYMQKLNEVQLAIYLRDNMKTDIIGSMMKIQKWLSKPVNKDGKEICLK